MPQMELKLLRFGKLAYLSQRQILKTILLLDYKRVVNFSLSIDQVEIAKHTMKYGGQIHHLCSDPCLSAFQYANKLDMNSCDQCGTLCTTLESSPHLVQFEGQQKRFCSDTCVNSFRTVNRKISPCAWCGSKKSNFDMIERLDSNNKFQLFCSLNCLSLYRVNLQVKFFQFYCLCDVVIVSSKKKKHLADQGTGQKEL